MDEYQFRELMDCLKDIAERLDAVETAVSNVEGAVMSVDSSVTTSDIYGIDDVVAALREVKEAVRDNG